VNDHAPHSSVVHDHDHDHVDDYEYGCSPNWWPDKLHNARPRPTMHATTMRLHLRHALAYIGLALIACGGTVTNTDVGAEAGDVVGVDGTDGTVYDVTPTDATDVTGDVPTDGSHVPMNHRPDDSQCTGAAPAGNCTSPGSPGNCHTDTDCTMGTNGRCVMNGGGAIFCNCSFDMCANDSACPSGQTCACHGSPYTSGGNACVTGNCRVDSNCGAGGFCSPSPSYTNCGGISGYYCHTSMDLCVNDGDCMGTTGLRICSFTPTSNRWECHDRLLCP
jgi:hypothetical protein